MTTNAAQELNGGPEHGLFSGPHKWPGAPPDDDSEVIAWKCAACGEWVSDGGPKTPCAVDWRSPLRQAAEALLAAVEFAKGDIRRLNPDEYAVNDFRQHKVWDAATDLTRVLRNSEHPSCTCVVEDDGSVECRGCSLHGVIRPGWSYDFRGQPPFPPGRPS